VKLLGVCQKRQQEKQKNAHGRMDMGHGAFMLNIRKVIRQPVFGTGLALLLQLHTIEMV
jgi:hypothetical protein